MTQENKENKLSQDSPLINLALLESLKNENIQDEMDLYSPYINYIIYEVKKEFFTLDDFRAEFNNKFGTTPPEAVLKMMLTRAKKNGVIKLENKQYIKNGVLLSGLVTDIETKKRKAHDIIERLVTNYIKHAKDDHDKNLSMEEAEHFIFDFMRQNLSSFINNMTITPFTNSSIKNNDYLTATFIKRLHEVKGQDFEDLLYVVKGIMLADYINYADKNSTKKNLDNLTVYIDSPLILGLLGYSGYSKQKELEELLKLFSSLNVKVRIYDITINEIERLFYAWKQDLARRYYNNFNPKTLELLKAKGIDIAHLDTELSLLESNIEKMGITITRGFSVKNEHFFDEKKFESFLKGKGKQSVLHDVKCVSRIHNSRESKSIRNLGEKMTIFVTLNIWLAEITNEYFSEEFGERNIPLLFNDVLITSLLWFKKPDLFENLPSKIIISNALAVINGEDKFWKSFISKLEVIKKRGDVSEDDFNLVRWNTTLMDKVHQASIESGTDFSEGDVFDIVENIKNENLVDVAREQEKYSNELVKMEEGYSEIIEDKDSSIRSLESQVDGFLSQYNRASSWIAHFILALIIAIPTLLIVLKNLADNSFISGFLTGNKLTNDAIISSGANLGLVANLFILLFGGSVVGLYNIIQPKLKLMIFNKIKPK